MHGYHLGWCSICEADPDVKARLDDIDHSRLGDDINRCARMLFNEPYGKRLRPSRRRQHDLRFHVAGDADLAALPPDAGILEPAKGKITSGADMVVHPGESCIETCGKRSPVDDVRCPN